MKYNETEMERVEKTRQQDDKLTVLMSSRSKLKVHAFRERVNDVAGKCETPPNGKSDCTDGDAECGADIVPKMIV